MGDLRCETHAFPFATRGLLARLGLTALLVLLVEELTHEPVTLVPGFSVSLVACSSWAAGAFRVLMACGPLRRDILLDAMGA